MGAWCELKLEETAGAEIDVGLFHFGGDGWREQYRDLARENKRDKTDMATAIMESQNDFWNLLRSSWRAAIWEARRGNWIRCFSVPLSKVKKLTLEPSSFLNEYLLLRW